MRRIICILMCLSMASMVSAALSITNGDFEAYGIREDVPSWFEEGGTYLRLLYSFNDTQYMGLSDDDSWAYQSIGTAGGAIAVTVQYEIGAVLPIEAVNQGTTTGEVETNPRNLNLTISIYESDGSFVGDDGDDIDGADGVTLIDSVTVSYPDMEVDVDVVTDTVTLNYLDTTTGELFLRFENAGDGNALVPGGTNETNDRFSIDNVQIVELASIVNPSPKDDTDFIAIERTSSENDLVFTVTDSDIVEVDVLFASDPNVSSIKTIESVTPGEYTVTLETELGSDLAWDTEHFWQVLAYEPNGLEVSLKYVTPMWSFTTIQEGPLLGDVDPYKLFVYPGEDAVFTLEDYNKTDTFQWYKEGDPDVALSNGADYAGVTTDTLTILDAQLDDAGIYYCIGTETATALTNQTDNSGELRIKELIAHYPFETVESGYTPDVAEAGGYSDVELFGTASLSDANSIVGKNLLLNNPVGNAYGKIADLTVADHDDITVSFWCFATTLVNETGADRWAPIFTFGDGSNEYMMFTLLYRQDDPRQDGFDVARSEQRWVDDEGGVQNPELDVEHPDIAAGRWYFVAITLEADEDGEGGSGRIYLGGERGTENETPQFLNVRTMAEINKTLQYLGKGWYSSPPLFNGRIDEFKIYNYVRTSAEIAQDYFAVLSDEPICDMENYDLYDYDFNRNCIVELSDFAEVAAHWLKDYTVVQD